jgi:hypothetical protein
MDFEARVQYKYSLTDEEAIDFVEAAKGFFYLLRYPSEPNANENTRPIETFVDEQLVLRICDEIAQKNGFNTVVGYRENGCSFDCDVAWLSDRLVGFIKPIIGVI